ncbi:MAG: 50S ribosomal protein L18 [Ktedonobacterales bacterium]|nr:50S ribosomal protein L18 [Ktedonobacterales bacterium]
MIKQFNSTKARQRRHLRVRKRLSGTTARPRLSIFRSSKHIYAQIIDDTTGRTLVTASSLEPDLRKAGANAQPTQREEGVEIPQGIAGIEANHKVALARAIGKALAERAKAHNISQVVFDRGGYQYHGRVAALATGAREGGLDF